MTRRPPVTLLVVALLGPSSLAACGSDTVSDPAAEQTSVSPSASPSGEPSPSPSAEPSTIGEWPAYPEEDYTYVLEAICFCAGAGAPVEITVRGGEVTRVVSTVDGPTGPAGTEIEQEWLRLTINDLLTEAAKPQWDKVQVDYPEGAAHPKRIVIDRMVEAVDDEVTYEISRVAAAPSG